MLSQPKFFALIIGTEILNRRRADKHFEFISKALLNIGSKLSGSFIIEDDPALIVQSIKFIHSQPNSILFSFGGIGSTPDDHTRKCAAIALRDGKLLQHNEAKDIISSRIDVSKFPHALNMSMLPKGAKLLDNPVNKMPAFYLDDRYFFMPGFPEMSHPMVEGIIERYFSTIRKIYHRYTLTAHCREGALISVMEQMSDRVEFSSLPKIIDDGWQTTISVASYDEEEAKKAFSLFVKELDEKDIDYGLEQ